jgi:hypothetical protein
LLCSFVGSAEQFVNTKRAIKNTHKFFIIFLSYELLICFSPAANFCKIASALTDRLPAVIHLPAMRSDGRVGGALRQPDACPVGFSWGAPGWASTLLNE